eukprot:COSAG06_NODE_1346_length_9780_cov_44.066729_3_plen_203_part_00
MEQACFGLRFALPARTRYRTRDAGHRRGHGCATGICAAPICHCPAERPRPPTVRASAAAHSHPPAARRRPLNLTWPLLRAAAVARSPMGWSSWNPYHAGVIGLDEKTIRAQADAMAQHLSAFGYSYINIDDFWAEHSRAANGSMVPSKSFPSGMKNLADHVHSKGLLFGLYTDVGTATCGGQPGAWGHECADAQMFAEWGTR